MNLRARSHKFGAEAGTSSMSDIMFFLMLFFLIVSTLVNPSVMKLMLPKAKSNTSLSKQPYVVEVDANRNMTFNKTPVDMVELESQIRAKANLSDETTIVLRFDNSLSIQDLVDVLAIGNRLKVKMVLATENKKE
jgi:biopolymer transport protein ExbD